MNDNWKNVCFAELINTNWPIQAFVEFTNKNGNLIPFSSNKNVAHVSFIKAMDQENKLDGLENFDESSIN